MKNLDDLLTTYPISFQYERHKVSFDVVAKLDKSSFNIADTIRNWVETRWN